MKSINEQVNEVMASKMSQKAKREELTKIGLTVTDIKMLFFIEKQAKKAKKGEIDLAEIIKRYTFGVEIECFNAPRATLLEAADRNGLQMRSEGYNHVDNCHYYKLVSDCSISGNDPVECVSPILKGDNSGFDSLGACCNALNEIGARVNRSTGLHVHVGGAITEKQYCNTFVNYYHLESAIDGFMAESRRDANYASSLHYTAHRRQVDTYRLLNATTHYDIERAFNNDRYYKINCVSWASHQTIEFRQHSGTTDYQKISMWARFCLKLVAWSADNRMASDVASIDEIPFLDDEEKAYFNSRKAYFDANGVAA